MTNPSLPLAIIVLAAGQGTRMKSTLPKVLHPLDGRPLIQHLLHTIRQLQPVKIVVVVGYEAELVQQAIGAGAIFIRQAEQKGTGHAVAQTETALKGYQGNILILYGDMPLLTQPTLQQLVNLQAENTGPLTMLTVVADDPRGFGRIIRNETGDVIAVVEEVVCTPEQLAIKELNVGVYCVQSAWLWPNLAKIKPSPKGEYYLTDLVALAVEQGYLVQSVTSSDLIETVGINTPEQLAQAETILKLRA